jgi:hypothetical protein
LQLVSLSNKVVWQAHCSVRSSCGNVRLLVSWGVHLGQDNVAFAASLISGILPLVFWIFAGSVGLTYFFAIAVGLFAGTFLATAAPFVSQVV